MTADVGWTVGPLATGATLASIAIAAVGVLALTPLLAKGLWRYGVVDHPSSRSSHSRPTARGAGLVTGPTIALAIGISPDQLTLSLAAAAILSTLLGGAEDLHGLRVAARLAGQGAIAVAFVASTWHFGIPLSWFTSVAALIFIVGFINAFNFMDGINGISAATAGIAGVNFAVLAQLRGVPDIGTVGIVLAVTAVCFLPFNFPNARIFLGDSGSYSFGAVIACTALAGWRAGLPADGVVAPLVIYLADTSMVLLQRLIRRQPVGEPHHDHAYQRLVALGATHVQSTTTVWICSALATVLGLAAAESRSAAHVAFDAGVLVVVGIYLALPVLLAARNHNSPMQPR